VIIDHGNGYQTYYAHCNTISVSLGADVSQGQAIATVGRTGNATGSHVHFEIRENGKCVNPTNYVAL
jgi:murein DD-endopeptidase MepM/ murein hydrolase activator NlpD